MQNPSHKPPSPTLKRLGSLLTAPPAAAQPHHQHCPVCHSQLEQQKCKVICRSEFCVYRIIYNCSEF
ncbi:MAG: hypothetical protein IGS03_16180 [Candidatus Sericytochromatia bacterium]|nr:hypothetical protein [Candidatus Sericytochromatia bacterium]